MRPRRSFARPLRNMLLLQRTWLKLSGLFSSLLEELNWNCRFEDLPTRRLGSVGMRNGRRGMIVLDTNVVSELTRPRPEQKVLHWVASQNSKELFISVVTEAELRYGVELLYPGSRKRNLEAAVLHMVNSYFAGRILSMERNAAPVYAEIRASRRIMGRPIKELDCMIAAIARVNGAPVATRDIYGFENCGIDVINPWED